MHPQVVQDHEGICPICGMALTPVHTEDGEKSDSAGISIDPEIVQNMGVRIAEVTRGRLSRVLHGAVRVVVAPEAKHVVRARVAGWIERLYVADVGYPVSAGMPLVDIGRDGKEALTLVAPVDGYVSVISVEPGAAIDAGHPIVTVVDVSQASLAVDLLPHQLSFVRIGHTARAGFSALPGRTFQGKVAMIAGTVDEGTGTTRAYIELEGDRQGLRPGMSGNLDLITVSDHEGTLVRRDAILDSGTRKTVFLAREAGRFEPRDVNVGAVADEWAEILSGLQQGDKVVVSGQFLLDSESRLEQALDKYRAGTWAPLLKSKPKSH